MTTDKIARAANEAAAPAGLLPPSMDRAAEDAALASMSKWRAVLRRLVRHPWFERIIIALIVVNAITLGLETSDNVMSVIGPFLVTLDAAVLSIFVIEILLRIGAYGWRFFIDPWNLFDVAVVGIALLPVTHEASVLRALRILRTLRLISAFPSMRRVLSGLIAAIPSMGTVILLLLLLFYIFSVMATQLYGDRFDEWFGTLGASAYTLFQIMTLEGWSDGIVRPVMKEYPMSWIFFITFILITSFAVLNLFIGIIVDSMQHQGDETREAISDAEAETEREVDVVLKEVQGLREELKALRAEISAGRGGGDRDGPAAGAND